jgi:hypothetical protein
LYNKNIWEDDVTPVNAENMNNIENGISDADYQLLSIVKQNNTTAINNTYTLDMENKYYKEFIIETLDSNAKTINIINASSNAELVLIVKYTNNATITFLNNIAWQNSEPPIYTIGKQTVICLKTDDGTAWYGFFIEE